MKKSQYPAFSNGIEFEMWMSQNCDRCVKSSRYYEKTDTYTKFRCAINREIIEAYIDDGITSERTYKICHRAKCPFIQTERKIYNSKKTKMDNQPKMFEI